MSWAQRLPLRVSAPARSERGSALGGVCSGLAEAAGVDVTLVRLSFAFLTFASGAGIVAYGGLWLAMDPPPGEQRSRRRAQVGVVLLALAALLTLRGLGIPDSLVWPAALAAAGGYLVQRHELRVVGFALIVLGIGIFATENGGGSGPLVGPGVVAVALLLVLGPWAWELARERDAERVARIRSEERSELAARVHDSVLQTLALIQRHPEDARRVAQLARRQERELRSWLYPGGRFAPGASLVSALEDAAAEVEELHGVRIEVVPAGGDASLDERTQSLVLAAREAMTNAAVHAGVEEVSVFLDVEPGSLTVFVRDRGRGFDPDAVPAGGHGLAESVRGRMARAGGRASVTSAPGDGTEVELVLERQP
jgi:signal transduction histidine kinase